MTQYSHWKYILLVHSYNICQCFDVFRRHASARLLTSLRLSSSQPYPHFSSSSASSPPLTPSPSYLLPPPLPLPYPLLEGSDDLSVTLTWREIWWRRGRRTWVELYIWGKNGVLVAKGESYAAPSLSLVVGMIKVYGKDRLALVEGVQAGFCNYTCGFFLSSRGKAKLVEPNFVSSLTKPIVLRLQ